jgi:hypothetical protein
VPVESIAWYAEGYPFVVCEGADLATRLAGRTQIFAALRPGVLPCDTDNDGLSTVGSFPALARAWHRQAMDLLVEVFVHRGFAEALSRRYFHGAPVLFPASVELLAVASEAVEASVALFKRRNCRTTGPLSGCVWSRRCHRRRRPGRHPSGVRGHHCRKRTRQH